MKQPAVYILATNERGTLYIGVTSDLVKRIYQHRNNWGNGFTGRYKIHRLVYFEQYSDINDAIKREKQLKKWKRLWKLELIENFNPGWKDLFKEVSI